MQPDVDTLLITTVSTPMAFSVEASHVPKNADAYCLTTTGSPGSGFSGGAISPQPPSAPAANAVSAGTLRTNNPPSARPAV